MLMVIKRSGKEEAFEPEKIKSTLAAASDELKKPLATSDINIIASELNKRLEGKEKITSKALFELLVGTLRREGYIELANSYVSNSLNFKRQN